MWGGVAPKPVSQGAEPCATDGPLSTITERAYSTLSSTLVEITPYVAVLIVLTLVGRTRMPAEAGEHYESDE